MTQTVKIKGSPTSGNTPTILARELGINYADGLLFWLDNASTTRSTPLRGKRTTTVTSSTSVTINSDSTDMHAQTALAGAVTYNAPTGTPVSGQDLWVRILDNGTARAVTWNAVFTATQGGALPAATIASTTVYVHFVYNTSSSKWEAVTSLPMS